MKITAHLYLDETVVAPSEEWTATLGGWYFLRIAQGQAYWLAESSAVDLDVGHVMILPPVRQGLLRASQLGVVRLQYFRFCPEFLVGLLTMFERQFLEKAALKPRLCPVRLAPNHSASVLFADVAKAKPIVEGLDLRASLLRVVARCFEWETFGKTADNGMVLPASKRLQVQLGQLTESELCDSAASALASRCGCSVQHLNRLFQAQFGVSLRSRQAELRLLRARQLLSETNLSIQDILKSIGARHVSYFNAQFRKEFGLTPAEFRRQRGKSTTSDALCGKLVA